MFRWKRRKNEVIAALIEEGLGFVVFELKLATISLLPPRLRRKMKKKAEHDLAESLVNALQRLGGLFVKGGQFLSTRPDLIPYKYASHLSKLQDKDSKVPFSEIEKVVKQSYGETINQIFKRFDKTPISSASIGQVHFAVLKDDTKVAVKVQRPNIDKIIKTDLRLLKWLVRKAEKYRPDVKKYNLNGALSELSRWTVLELDYNHEAQVMNKFHKMLENSKFAAAPKPRIDMTTNKVLIMDWVGGSKISSQYKKPERYRLAKMLVDSMAEQYIKYGFFHGDPHPGNVHVSNDGRVVFLDFGITGMISKKHKQNLIRIMTAIVSNDCESLTKEIISLNLNKKQITYGRLYDSNHISLDEYQHKKLTFSKLFYNILLNAVENQIKLPVDYLLLAKSIVTADEIVRKLDPHITLEKEFETIYRGEFDGKNLVSEYIDQAADIVDKAAKSIGINEEPRKITKKIFEDVTNLVNIIFGKKRV